MTLVSFNISQKIGENRSWSKMENKKLGLLIIGGFFLVGCSNEEPNTAETNQSQATYTNNAASFCNAEESEDGTCSGSFDGDFWDILDEPGIVIEGDGVQTIEVDVEQDGQNTIEAIEEDEG